MSLKPTGGQANTLMWETLLGLNVLPEKHLLIKLTVDRRNKAGAERGVGFLDERHNLSHRVSAAPRAKQSS